ncbi:MAG: hypothetical protein H9917_08325 [Candidatus Oceanisphaera merdipullorum]|nr:hypothetical protein [Candidatus Oceanisphaera merdipullorum]
MLISVLFIMVVLAALMAAIATLTSQSSQQLVYEVQALKARLDAESTLEKQIFVLLDDINEPAVTQSSINGCEAVTSTLSPAATPRKQVNIITTGKCNTGQLTVIRNIEVEVINI